MDDHDAVGEEPVEHEASAREGIRGLGGIPAGRVVRWTAVVIALLVYAWWAVSLPPFSGTATAAVLLGGGAALVWGAGKPRRPRPEIEFRRAGAWAVLLALGGLWQLAAYVQHPRDDHPTLSSLANTLLDSDPARAAAFLLWILAAVQLSRR